MAFKWPDYYTGGSWSIGIRSSKYYGTEEQLVGCSDTNSPYYPCDFSSDIVYNDGNEFYAKRDGIKTNAKGIKKLKLLSKVKDIVIQYKFVKKYPNPNNQP